MVDFYDLSGSAVGLNPGHLTWKNGNAIVIVLIMKSGPDAISDMSSISRLFRC